MDMSFSVQASIDGHRIIASADTAKEAFAKAVDWQVAKQFSDITISHGRASYSIARFSEKMALAEIKVTERSFDSF
jgi:phosphopantetheinyl transferase (holo-ACP synthase)